MPGLLDLPTELILQIHLLSLSSSLPIVSRACLVFFADASEAHIVSYLTGRHRRKTLESAMRYGVGVRMATVLALERWAATGTSKGKTRKLKLKLKELPRRLVARLPLSPQPAVSLEGTVDLELARHLLAAYGASASSHNGYLLARAVLARHNGLIDLLLEFGADPGKADGWAVVVACERGDLELVKRLVEPAGDVSGIKEDEESVFSSEEGHRKRKRQRKEDKRAKKRVKREDRCNVTSGMLEAALKHEHLAVVDYLMAKGARPSLEVLKMLA